MPKENLNEIKNETVNEKYKCMVCTNTWTKEQLINGTCGDAFCGANVEKVPGVYKKE